MVLGTALAISAMQ